MRQFKRGDRVLCMSMDPGYSDKLKVGHIYTILTAPDYTYTNSPYLYVQENNGINCYECHHFKLAIPDSIFEK